MKIKLNFIVLAITLLSFSSAGVSQNEVYLFNSVPGKCSVVFPAQFTENITEDDISKTYKASCSSDGMYFMVNARVYDLDAETEKILEEQKEEMLQATMENFNNNIKGEILHTVKSSNNGEEGKTSTIAVGEKKVFYSVYIKGKIEYQVVIIEIEVGSLSDRSVNDFKNSFEIL